MTIDAPLGIDNGRNVSLVLKEQSGGQVWEFSLTSSQRNDPKVKVLSHGKGLFGFNGRGADEGAQGHHYDRLMKDRIRSIRAAAGMETLKTRRIYGLFSRIVDYGPILKGMTSITLAETEAVAEIEVPTWSSAQASSAGLICDTATLDNFIQVAGLLINTSEDCGAEEAFLAVGVGNIVIDASVDLVHERDWKVYASYTLIDGSRARADVALFSKDQVLITIINGINFAKLTFKRLQKLLATANDRHDRDAIKPNIESVQSHEPTASSDSETVSASGKPADVDGPLKHLLATVLETPDGIIPADKTMSELGLDSLSAAELTDALQTDFNVRCDLSDLPEMTYEDLRSVISSNSSKNPLTPKTWSSVTSITNGDDKSPPDAHKQSPLRLDTLPTGRTSRSEVTDPANILSSSATSFDKFASRRGFSNYWKVVSPKQDELMLAYISEAFQTLAVNLHALNPDEDLPSLQVLPKRRQVLQRLYQILERLGVIAFRDSAMVRTPKIIGSTPAATILHDFEGAFPAYANEMKLLSLTGNRLADSLTEKRTRREFHLAAHNLNRFLVNTTNIPHS